MVRGGGIFGGINKFIGGALKGGAFGGVVGAGAGGIGAVPGALIGGAAGGFGALLGDDIISSPGYGDRALLTQNGVIGLNNNDTVLAGTQLMSPGALQSSMSSTQQSAQQTNVTVDMSKLEAKLDKLASAFAGIKIEMDGNTVGRVSLNARSPLDRLSVVG